MQSKLQNPKLDRGYYQVTCRECGGHGQVRVSRATARGRVHAAQDVEHAAHCSLYVAEQAAHLKKKAWTAQEEHANSLVGAQNTIASGAANEDGDGRVFHGWRVESKGTTAALYTLRQDTWTKLVRGALSSGEEPLLHVKVNRGGATETELVVVRRDYYESGEPRWPLTTSGNIRNRVSARITPLVETPFVVPLNPEGIALTERQFLELKGKIDGDRGHLPSPPGESIGRE